MAGGLNHVGLLISAFVVIACAIFNRMRGDESWKPACLHGRALFYVTPIVAAISCHVQPWLIALAIGAGYAFWAVWGWGHVLARISHLRPTRGRAATGAPMSAGMAGEPAAA